jgi:hypothetical protein
LTALERWSSSATQEFVRSIDSKSARAELQSVMNETVQKALAFIAKYMRQEGWHVTPPADVQGKGHEGDPPSI